MAAALLWALAAALPAVTAAAAGKNGTAPSPAAADWEATKESKMAAVNKIITMMKELQTQVNTEGEDEARMYNKFACFCKDTMKDKGEAVQDGEDSKDALTAEIGELQSNRADLDTDIAQLETAISDTRKTMDEAQETRDAELKQYEADDADLRAALDALRGAIKELKAAKTFVNSEYEGFLQTKRQALGAKVQHALLLAEALGFAPEAVQRATAFFQQGQPSDPAPQIPTEAYTFKSGTIIETLEGLQKAFTDKKTEVDKAEVTAASEHDKFMQDEHHKLALSEKQLQDTQKLKAEKQEAIATKSSELTTVAAVLLDDQEYLKELSKLCHEKAVTWDQRSGMRAEELQAITAVIGILEGAVTDKMSGATVRFNQFAVTLRRAEGVARNEKAMEAVEASAEAAESGAAPSLVQVARHNDGKGRPAGEERARQAAINLLKSSSMRLKSSSLASLVGQLADDPFAKVKTLIEELIERLLKEASNEATQKGWCDKSMGAASQKRDYAAEAIAGLNSNMASLEATRDKLVEELDVLADEVTKLKEARAEAEALRAKEKQEHATIVSEANFGVEAMTEAIKIIDQFYKKARKAEVTLAFAQEEPPEFGAGAEGSYNPVVVNTAKPTESPVAPGDQAPDSGFDSGEAYTGAAGVEGGVLGMLEVIKSDFERTVTETEKDEREAAQEHLEFMTETGKSLAEKEVAVEEKTKQKDDAEEKLSNDKDSLKSETDVLKTAVEELIQLHGACVDTGMSMEERMAAREDEIEALKKALCVLEGYEKYGPNGIGDDGSC